MHLQAIRLPAGQAAHRRLCRIHSRSCLCPASTAASTAELPAVLRAASSQAPAYRDYPSTEPSENDLALPPFLAKGSAQAQRRRRQ